MELKASLALQASPLLHGNPLHGVESTVEVPQGTSDIIVNPLHGVESYEFRGVFGVADQPGIHYMELKGR